MNQMVKQKTCSAKYHRHDTVWGVDIQSNSCKNTGKPPPWRRSIVSLTFEVIVELRI